MSDQEMILLLTFLDGTFFVLVALLLGSFINLAIDRVPRGESIVRPRSHCRSCGRVLNVVDLIPVAGYLIRGGRCASCKAPIGGSAPLVEASTGGCMLVSIVWLGLWPGAVLGLAMIVVIGVVLVRLARTRAGGSAKAS
jgi:prepilin signal peptidase PulO-like enzyme (type II secretory pathway)